MQQGIRIPTHVCIQKLGKGKELELLLLNLAPQFDRQLSQVTFT